MKVQVLKNASQGAAHKTYVIEHDNKLWLQAYDRIICRFDNDTKKLEVSTFWTQSKATQQYLLTFLNQYDILKCKTNIDLFNAQVDGKFELVKEII